MGDLQPRVRCRADGDGWRCDVVVGDDADATQHTVAVTAAYRDECAPTADPEALVAESFAFLLEREPRESILRHFELPVIERYFPEYRAEIRRRMR